MRKTLFGIAVICLFLPIHLVKAQPAPDKPYVPYKILGSIKNKTTLQISGSNLSVGGETMDRDYTVYKSWSPYLEELGIKKVRLQGGWAKCEKVKGVYDWDWLDEPIFDLPKKGITPWVNLCYGNPLYGRGEIKLGSKIDVDEETLNAWLRWVEAMVNRYKGVVTEWEIWNEPNGHNEADIYAQLLIPTAELIKRIQPDAKTIGFVLAGINLQFTEDVLKILKSENKAHLVDYLCYHPYNFNPDDSYKEVQELHILMKKYAPKMELLQGENGAPSEYRQTKALRGYEWTELTQAKWALRRMLGDLGRDIPSSIFSIIDLKYPDEMNRKGLLYANEDKSVNHKKQAYYAVQNLATVFDDRLERVSSFTAQSNSQHKYAAFGYKDKSTGGSIAALWLHTNRPTDYNATMPINIQFDGLSFEKPVWVDLRSGTVYEIPKHALSGKSGFKGLMVYDSPILIAEKALIELK